MPRGARDSRGAIFHAAAAEFAARGFAGTGVDRIARRAGVNKAMIYYHFKDKAHLYREIVREMFTAIGTRTGAVASGRLPAGEKLDLFIESIVTEARLRPHIPPIMMREAAEGGPHLHPDVLRIILGVISNLRTILTEGVRTGAFKRVDPVLMYFTLVGPIVMYLAAAPVRNALGQLKGPGLPPGDSAGLNRHLTSFGDVDALGEHLKAGARRVLERAPVNGRLGRTSGPRTTRRRRAAHRSGEQA